MNYEYAEELIKPIQEYSKTLSPSDRVRLAGYLVSLVDSVQQDRAVPDKLIGFERVDGLCFDFHTQLDNLADDFDDVAEIMDKESCINETKKIALSKLTELERAALGV